MADKVSIKGLGVSLDSVLDKIEKVGVSLAGLVEYGPLLEEVDRLTDEILSKKRELASSGLSESAKGDLQNRLDGLVTTMRSGGDTRQEFKGINRIGSLSGGPTFSPAFQSRVEDAGKGMKRSGMAGGALKSLVLSDLRRLGLVSGGGSSASQGGMNAFMAMRITQLGDALMGVGAIADNKGDGTSALVKDREEEAIDETLNIIRTTSDEILDALGSRSSVSGRISQSSASRIDIRPRSKEGGFSWGGLLKTLGTVGLIGGVAFGALSSPTVQQWLADMQDPEKRKEQWDGLVDRIKGLWDGANAILSKIWQQVGKVSDYVTGVNAGDISGLGKTFSPVYSDLSMDQKTLVDSRLDAEKAASGVYIEGVGESGWDRAVDLGKSYAWDALLVGGGVKALQVTGRSLVRLYLGESAVAVFGTAGLAVGAALGGAAVLAVMGAIGKHMDERARKEFNVLSAKAAMEAKQSYFCAYVDGTRHVEMIPFIRLKTKDGQRIIDSMSPSEQRGLMVKMMADERDIIYDQQVGVVLSHVLGNLEDYGAKLATSGSVGEDLPAPVKEELAEISSLHERGRQLQISKDTAGSLAYLKELQELGFLDWNGLSYAVLNDMTKLPKFTHSSNNVWNDKVPFILSPHGISPDLQELGLSAEGVVNNGRLGVVKGDASRMMPDVPGVEWKYRRMLPGGVERVMGDILRWTDHFSTALSFGGWSSDMYGWWRNKMAFPLQQNDPLSVGAGDMPQVRTGIAGYNYPGTIWQTINEGRQKQQQEYQELRGNLTEIEGKVDELLNRSVAGNSGSSAPTVIQSNNSSLHVNAASHAVNEQ